MSEEIRAAGSLLAELARLTMERDTAYASRDQALRAARAERAARENAEARLDAYGDHQPQCPLHNDLRGVCTCGFSTLTQERPTWLVELDAARAVVKAAWPLANDPAYVAIPRLTFALRAALTAYDAKIVHRSSFRTESAAGGRARTPPPARR